MYGLSEIIGPGVAVQCREVREGSHVNEDHFLAEVVDPETGEPLPDGAEGELVFSTLTKEALPLLRYRTGDIASLDPAPCACGRTLARMGTVRGRRDDMLIVRGVNLYPSEIEHALLHVEGVAPHYQLVRRAPGRPRRADGPLRARRRTASTAPRLCARASPTRCASAPASASRSSCSRPARSRAARARRCAWSTGARADAFAYFQAISDQISGASAFRCVGTQPWPPVGRRRKQGCFSGHPHRSDASRASAR